MDSVSCFTAAVQSSLKSGTIRNCDFCVPFRTDVFNFLFKTKGSVVNRTKSRYKSYNLSDFDTQHFTDINWYVVHDRLGNGCKLEFPVDMFSTLKYSPKVFCKDSTGTVTTKPRTFTEVVYVSVVKHHC